MSASGKWGSRQTSPARELAVYRACCYVRAWSLTSSFAAPRPPAIDRSWPPRTARPRPVHPTADSAALSPSRHHPGNAHTSDNTTPSSSVFTCMLTPHQPLSKTKSECRRSNWSPSSHPHSIRAVPDGHVIRHGKCGRVVCGVARRTCWPDRVTCEQATSVASLKRNAQLVLRAASLGKRRWLTRVSVSHHVDSGVDEGAHTSSFVCASQRSCRLQNEVTNTLAESPRPSSFTSYVDTGLSFGEKVLAPSTSPFSEMIT